MFPSVVNTSLDKPARQRRRGRGCTLGCLTTLILLVIIIGAGWFFALRPFLHGIAETALDNAMTSAVNQMPAQAGQQIPSGGITVPIKEDTINNLVALNIAPSNPVKSPATHITTTNIRMQFQIYGYQCAISAAPQTVNGQLKVHNVAVEGIVGLIMSPDEITALLNKHLADAQRRLQHNVTAVQLKDQELDLTLE